MNISEKYKDKKVAVLGFGLEGQATFEYLARNGINAKICDQLNLADFIERNPRYRDCDLLLGEKYLNSLGDFDFVFKTPGISPLLPEIKIAEKQGTVFTSQIEEFFDLCPVPIIGVTGTKGKGTTSTLIYDMLKNAGRDAYLGGNIGIPAISFLDDLKENSIVVLELSSFQLQVLRKSPQIAVLLNVTSEHLDYHQDTAEYREAKANILKYQKSEDFALINADYEVSLEMAKVSKAKKLYFSRYKEVNGCYVNDNDEIVLNYDESERVLAGASELKLRGRHNLENATAAALAASVAGVSADVATYTLVNFTGLEHRLELVREVNNVKYYNDSFSTVPETAIAAIDSFSEPVVLIAGGSSKKSDYTELGKKIAASNVKAIILIGDTAEEIKASIPSFEGEIVLGLTRMSDVVAKAAQIAEIGDVILLSPASASFGLFTNYKDRGDQFKNSVFEQ